MIDHPNPQDNVSPEQPQEQAVGETVTFKEITIRVPSTVDAEGMEGVSISDDLFVVIRAMLEHSAKNCPGSGR